MIHLKTCLLAIVLLLSIPAEAQISAQLKDFDVFEKGLLSIEAKTDRHVSQDSVTAMLASMRRQFSEKVLTPTEQFKLYAHCIDLIQSGHTQVFPSKSVMKYYILQKKALPFDMEIVNKRLYVIAYPKTEKGRKAVKKEDQIPAGSEITAIDGQSIDEWMRQIGRFIGSDENDPVFEYSVAAQQFDFYRYLATTTHQSHLKVDYISKRDTLSKLVELGYPPFGVRYDRLEKLQKERDKAEESIGTFKTIGNAGYFRFPSFSQCIGKDYTLFLKKSFTKIRKNKLKTVVIDVRGNGGGIIQTELLSYFLSEPTPVINYQIVKRPKGKALRHVRKRDEKFHTHKKNVRRYRRAERKIPGFNGDRESYSIDTNLVFKGKIIVLTDEGSFSAASFLAGQLKELRQAQIMGSRPGGSYYAFNAGTLRLTLPKSGIIVFLNPNSGQSLLYSGAADPHIKDVDVEIIPEYSPKPSVYKKNWEEVVKIALRTAK